jgi:O-antigen biosynthesis protein
MTDEPNQNASIYLGDALAKLERYEEAIVAYRKAIETNPNFSEPYLKLAEILVKLERWQESAPIYRKIIELIPNFNQIPEIVANLDRPSPAPIATQQQVTIAKLHQQAIQRNPDRLVNYYAAIDFQPQNSNLYLGLGNVLAKKGYFDKAIVVYRMALQINPAFGDVYYNLAQILTHSERYPEAVECWQKFRQIQPSRVKAEDYCKLGKALFAQEKYAEAATFLRQTLELQPNDYEAHYLLGQILASENKWGEAIAHYQQASKTQPQRWEAHHLLGEAWQEIGKLEEAVKAYQKAIEAQENISWCHNGLGSVLLKLHRWGEAVIAYRRSIELKADFPWAHYNLGDALNALEQRDEAIVAYRQAIRLQPNLTHASKKLVSLLRQRAKQDFTDALNYFAPETELDVDNTSSSFHLVWNALLHSRARLVFPAVTAPIISVVIVLDDRAELSLNCLNSLLQQRFQEYETIVVTRSTSTETQSLLARLDNIKLVTDNLDRAIETVTGTYLLFIKNTMQMSIDLLQTALETIESNPPIAAVIGKTIDSNGTLQEAGGTLDREGNYVGFGWGDNPWQSEYMYRRPIETSNSAFFLTKRREFLDLGSFDRDYNSLEAKITDYCLRVGQAGREIVYDPNIILFASHIRIISNITTVERELLLSKHQKWLQRRSPRHLDSDRPRILFLDDCLPHTEFGTVSRTHRILSSLAAAGSHITFYPTIADEKIDWQKIYTNLPASVEVTIDRGLSRLKEFLEERQGYYDFVVVSKPSNMDYLHNILAQDNYLQQSKIIYNAEAIYCLQEFAQLSFQGKSPSPEEQQNLLETELKVARHSHCILAASPQEAQYFRDYGYDSVRDLGHSVAPNPTPNTFEERREILFIGGVRSIHSPNSDSIQWLVREIFPKIQADAIFSYPSPQLLIASNRVQEIEECVNKANNSGIVLLDLQDNPDDLYNRSRLFVAPMRYGASLPLKIYEAAARGLPIVTTSFVASQLGWQPEKDLLTADNTEDFAEQCRRLDRDRELWYEIRNNAMERIRRECSPTSFDSILKEIFTSIDI